MPIDLVLPGLNSGVTQEAFLLFQFDLDAHAVENFQLDSDGRDAGSVNGAVYPIVVGAFDAENRTGKITRQFGLHETQSDHGPEKHDLPVEQARPWEIALDQAEDALVDEGGEGPDVILVDVHGAKL